jgi:hypothetical protein
MQVPAPPRMPESISEACPHVNLLNPPAWEKPKIGRADPSEEIPTMPPAAMSPTQTLPKYAASGLSGGTVVVDLVAPRAAILTLSYPVTAALNLADLFAAFHTRVRHALGLSVVNVGFEDGQRISSTRNTMAVAGRKPKLMAIWAIKVSRYQRWCETNSVGC